MIPLANHKLTFDIGQFHYKLLLYSKIAKAQWGCRRRAGQTENEWVYLIQVNLK